MFGIFENNSEVAEAKIFFGSTEESNENVQERKSPFDDAVVSRVPLCNADDTIKAYREVGVFCVDLPEWFKEENKIG